MADHDVSFALVEAADTAAFVVPLPYLAVALAAVETSDTVQFIARNRRDISELDFFPAPQGSGAIEEAAIGELAIGQAGFRWQDTVISQYANNKRMMTLIERLAGAFDGTEWLDDFYNQIWNVQTAIGYGLDVWGRIVDISRIVRIVPPSVYFGFAEGGSILGYQPFNQAPFYSGQPIGGSGYRLADDAYRRLIYAKAAANIWDGSIAQANAILRTLFPGRVAYVVDNQDMTMTYHFTWTLTLVDAAVALRSGVLPRPSGVKVIYEQE